MFKPGTKVVGKKGAPYNHTKEGVKCTVINPPERRRALKEGNICVTIDSWGDVKTVFEVEGFYFKEIEVNLTNI